MPTMKAVCIRTCTTPEHGFVEEGMKVEFEINSWSKKDHPYLKHFEQVSGHSGPVHKTVEEGIASQKTVAKPRPQCALGGAAGPEIGKDVPAQKFGDMTPDELAALSEQNIVDMVKGRHGIELDMGLAHPGLILKAIEIENNPTDVLG